MIRYADDFVVCFQFELDAVKFRRELGNRLGKFGLEVEPTKTRVMKFGRFAVQNAKAKGEKPETFDFLGLTHYCGTRRDGLVNMTGEIGLLAFFPVIILPPPDSRQTIKA
jgi:hypothetical protein